MGEVLLPNLFLSVPFSGVLLDRLEAILFLAIRIDMAVEELADLLPVVEHVLRW